MRLAPVPLFFAHAPETAIARSADSSRTTHGATEAVDACRYMAATDHRRLAGKIERRIARAAVHPGRRSLGDASRSRRKFMPSPRAHSSEENRRTSAAPATSSNRSKQRCGRSGKSTSFEHGALLAVNLGRDADTTGAVYGQIAGAYYGVEAYSGTLAVEIGSSGDDRELRRSGCCKTQAVADKCDALPHA